MLQLEIAAVACSHSVKLNLAQKYQAEYPGFALIDSRVGYRLFTPGTVVSDSIRRFL
jgi:hypothetical protein